MTRTELLNFLIKKYNLKRYLEIGVQNPAQNFDKIQAEFKVSVDPDTKAKAGYCLTSDEYFDNILNDQLQGGTKFDLIFIDGLHHADQVEKDFTHAQKALNYGGFIVIHDCNPIYEQHTLVPRPTPTGHWHGDVYKFAARLTNKLTVNIDCGCLVADLNTYITDKEINWDYFDENRVQLLNLIGWNEFINIGSHV